MKSKANRKKTRRLLYQELYANTFGSVNPEDFYTSFYDGIYKFEKDNEYLNSMKKIIDEKEGFLINVIEKYSPKFDIKKMNVVNILPIYISLSEIFFLEEEIPIKSSINEAIELAKLYSDESSKKIVNGVLNSVFLDYENLEKIKNNQYKKLHSIFK